MSLHQQRRSRFRRSAGISWIEVLVAIVIIVVLISLSLPAITAGPKRSPMTQTFSNAKQLHLATQQMVLDGLSTGEKSLGWPGDTGGTFTNWSHQLVSNGYLTTNDFVKLMSAPGVVPPAGKMPRAEQCALLIYAVSANSASNAVFITSANFTNTPTGGVPPGRKAKPYGDEGFVVFRKAGDGVILQARQAGRTNLIGAYEPLCR